MHPMDDFGGFGGPMLGGFGGPMPSGMGMGLGGGLLGDLLAAGLGYHVGRRSAQGNAQYAASYQQYPQQAPYPQQATMNPASQRMTQLKLLGQLRESGIVTEEEFQLCSRGADIWQCANSISPGPLSESIVL